MASEARPGGALTADVRVLDEDGLVQVSLEGVRLVPVAPDDAGTPRRARERELLYAVDWRPSPHSARSKDRAVGLESPATLAGLGSSQLDGVRASHGLDTYDEMTPELDAVAAAYVVQALGALGWTPASGEEATAAGLAARLGILGQYVPLVERFLEILGEDGVVRAGLLRRLARAALADCPSIRRREWLSSRSDTRTLGPSSPSPSGAEPVWPTFSPAAPTRWISCSRADRPRRPRRSTRARLRRAPAARW